MIQITTRLSTTLGGPGRSRRAPGGQRDKDSGKPRYAIERHILERLMASVYRAEDVEHTHRAEVEVDRKRFQRLPHPVNPCS